MIESQSAASGPASTEPSAGQIRQWAAIGIVAAVSRFVPVPLLDDVVKERATRLAIARTLKAHDRPYDVTDVEVLYTGADDSWFAGAKKYLLGVPARIVLFPVRKYVAVFGAVKGVPSDVMGVILLSRTVHRSLARGGLATTDEKALRREARQVRKAYESAFEEMDLRLITGALGDALSSGRGLTSAAADFAQRMVDHLPGRHSDDDAGESQNNTTAVDDAPPGLSKGQGLSKGNEEDQDLEKDLQQDLHQDLDPELEQGAEEVEQVLRRPEIARLIEEFDRRVDAYLATDK